MLRCLLALLEEYDVPISLIEQIRLVFGGDHGQGAFRLCFRVLIDVLGRDKPIYKTSSIAEVHCKKEKGVILEESIMDWLEKDLKHIEDSELSIKEETGIVVQDDKGNVICDNGKKYTGSYVDKGTDWSTPNKRIIPVIQFLTGDFAWQSYCLGKENMSGDWCMYCPKSPVEWSVPNYCTTNAVDLWTIEGLCEMAASNKKGAKRLGVKVEPKFKWIPLTRRILPVTHELIGLLNDCIVYFEEMVEWEIIVPPAEEKVMMERVKRLKGIIDEKVAEMNAFKDDANGGKKRTSLMNKVRRMPADGTYTQAQLQDRQQLSVLDAQFKLLASERDKVQDERKRKLDKINEAIKKRRVDDKGWYIPMEKIYLNHKVEREDYHKRKFSGRPLKMIMTKALGIFTDAKALLYQHMDPNKDKAVVDKLCDEMIELLTNWKSVFDMLLKGGTPTEENIQQLQQHIDAAIKTHRKVNTLLTPKSHTMHLHGAWQYSLHKNLPLIIEEFVERNHQDGKHVDNQTKRIPDAKVRGKSAAKRRGLDILAPVEKRIKLVHASTARGPYKKSDGNSTSSTTSTAAANAATPARNSTMVASTPAADNNLGTAVTPSLTSPPDAGVHVGNRRNIPNDGVNDAMDTT